MANFQQSLVTGHQTEREIARRLINNDWTIKKVHQDFGYDLHGKKGNLIKHFEVKSFGDSIRTNACFELTNKYGHLAEYLKNADNIDYLIRYNWCTGKAYVMDFKVLAPFLIKAATVKDFGRHMIPIDCSQRKNVGDEGAIGIVMDVTSPVIGFIKELL
jgi:hypothetical protein